MFGEKKPEKPFLRSWGSSSPNVKCYVLVFKSKLLANPKHFSHPLTWIQDLESKNIDCCHNLKNSLPFQEFNLFNGNKHSWKSCALSNMVFQPVGRCFFFLMFEITIVMCWVVWLGLKNVLKDKGITLSTRALKEHQTSKRVLFCFCLL